MMRTRRRRLQSDPEFARMDSPADNRFRRGFLAGGWLKTWRVGTASWCVAALFLVAPPQLGAGMEDTTQQLYLSGRDSSDAIPWDFRVSSGSRAGEWSTIPVPSNWEMHGYGTLSYKSVTPDEVGEYRRKFTVPAGWNGRRVFLIFDGAMTDTTVKLNGAQVGATHQGGFYRFKYEVTQWLQYKAENNLEVLVAETSADESVNRAERQGDYWNFGGIFRPVRLEAVPERFIERLAVDARADGSMTVDVFVNGQGPGTLLSGEIATIDGQVVGRIDRQELTADGDPTRLHATLASPRTWSSEDPFLYQVTVRLEDKDGILHQLGTRFGFRTFEVRSGQGLFLNGHRIVLQGVNRHSFYPDSGRCLSEANHLEDIRLMKEMNMNAVRMSHYPPDERFLELCDELGLFVLDELAGWQKAYSAEAGRPLVRAMVERDSNHPSILFWDNGNEGGWNTALDQNFAQWDPQHRPVLHPWKVNQGVNTSHYPDWNEAVQMAQGEIPARWHKRNAGVGPGPFIAMPTELLHGLYDGGAGAGLEDYWTSMRKAPYFGGGFIWSFVDEGVLRPESKQIDVHGNSAPDGILGPYREKEASYYAIKELWSPIAITERDISEDFSGELNIENRYSFTNTAACRFSWRLQRLPLPQAANLAVMILSEGEAPAPAILPGQQGKLRLPLPGNWREADVLTLRVDDNYGRELWTWTWALPGIRRMRSLPELGQSTGASQPTIQETDAILRITVGEMSLGFDRGNGGLVEVRRGKRQYSLTNGPKFIHGDSTLTAMHWRIEGQEVVIQSRYEGPLKSVDWRIRPDGWINCQFLYATDELRSTLGISFDYPEEKVTAKQWVGEGPYRVWQNRLRGTQLGLWATPYNDTITGQSSWIYPEFKGCFAGIRWLTMQTTEGPISLMIHSEGMFVQVLTPSFPADALARGAAVHLPTAGLVFLHTIPPVGTKFHPPEKLGPQGQLRSVTPECHGSVSFYFGPGNL